MNILHENGYGPYLQNVSNNKMKNNLLKYILLIFVLFSLSLHAQENEIGFNTGFGKTTVDKYNMKFVLPFNKEHADYIRFGFCYYFTPKDAIFILKSGLDYDIKWKNDIRLNYFRTPIGLDFNFGKKVQFLIGGGLFASYLIAYSGISSNTDFENSKNRFQIGWFANTGIGVQISEKYNLSIKYQYSADITKMYDEHRTSPGGSPYELDAKSYDGFVVMCLKYKLKKE